MNPVAPVSSSLAVPRRTCNVALSKESTLGRNGQVVDHNAACFVIGSGDRRRPVAAKSTSYTTLPTSATLSSTQLLTSQHFIVGTIGIGKKGCGGNGGASAVASIASEAETYVRNDLLWKELQKEIRSNGAVTTAAVQQVSRRYLCAVASQKLKDEDLDVSGRYPSKKPGDGYGTGGGLGFFRPRKTSSSTTRTKTAALTGDPTTLRGCGGILPSFLLLEALEDAFQLALPISSEREARPSPTTMSTSTSPWQLRHQHQYQLSKAVTETMSTTETTTGAYCSYSAQNLRNMDEFVPLAIAGSEKETVATAASSSSVAKKFFKVLSENLSDEAVDERESDDAADDAAMHEIVGFVKKDDTKMLRNVCPRGSGGGGGSGFEETEQSSFGNKSNHHPPIRQRRRSSLVAQSA